MLSKRFLLLLLHYNNEIGIIFQMDSLTLTMNLQQERMMKKKLNKNSYKSKLWRIKIILFI